MITPGIIAPRRDSNAELFVAVLSNSIHLSANTGRVIVCPFIPGKVSGDRMAMVVTVDRPRGTLLPELVQWLPVSALDEPIGAVTASALRNVRSLVTALIS